MPAAKDERTARWKRLALGAAVLVAAGAGAAVFGFSAPMQDANLRLCAYKLTFEDDFDTLDIAPRDASRAKWIAHTPWNGDFGDAVFTDPGPLSPFKTENGVLSITASKDGSGQWRSGLIASADGETRGFSQQYGYFEARMKLPEGPGTWPAFWLGTNEPRNRTAASIEVDIIEQYGHEPDRLHSVVHLWEKNPLRSTPTSHRFDVPEGEMQSGFHLYGAKVTPAFITMYYDRQPIWQTPTPAEHRMPLLLMANLALGSGFPIDGTPDPSVLQIDYIRAYDISAADADACRDGDPSPDAGG